MEQLNKTLYHNGIKNFILKIDFISNDVAAFASIVNEISTNFTRLEQRIHTNFNIIMDEAKVRKEQTPDFVLINNEKGLNLTFSTFHNAMSIEMSQYINNKGYKECIATIKEAIIKLGLHIQSKRIGMRYINSFQCNALNNIKKIFNKEKAKIITGICNDSNLSRVIIQEEFNTENSKLRSQYGIPNKLYPAKMTTYDLLLDIDSYDDSMHSFDEWDDVIRTLNHEAYGKFIELMNPDFIETLK